MERSDKRPKFNLKRMNLIRNNFNLRRLFDRHSIAIFSTELRQMILIRHRKVVALDHRTKYFYLVPLLVVA